MGEAVETLVRRESYRETRPLDSVEGERLRKKIEFHNPASSQPKETISHCFWKKTYLPLKLTNQSHNSANLNFSFQGAQLMQSCQKSHPRLSRVRQAWPAGEWARLHGGPQKDVMWRRGREGFRLGTPHFKLCKYLLCRGTRKHSIIYWYSMETLLVWHSFM